MPCFFIVANTKLYNLGEEATPTYLYMVSSRLSFDEKNYTDRK
jgi:hypothetical protein